MGKIDKDGLWLLKFEYGGKWKEKELVKRVNNEKENRPNRTRAVNTAGKANKGEYRKGKGENFECNAQKKAKRNGTHYEYKGLLMG